MANSFFNTALLGAAGSQVTPTITLHSSGGITFEYNYDLDYTFSYDGNIPAGSFVVIVVTARSKSTSHTGSWTGITDSAGNTFSEAIAGTQDNNLTFSAIYSGVLGTSVTSSTNITASSTQSPGDTEFRKAKHYSIFVLTGVTQVDNTASAPNSTSTNALSNSATTTTGNGIALHVLSTGTGQNPTVNSVSSGYTSLSLPASNCGQYSARKVIDGASANSTESSTITMSRSGKYANIFATFK